MSTVTSCEKLTLHATVTPVVSFVMQQNSISILKSLSIANDGDRDAVEVVVTIRAEPEFCREVVLTIDSIPKNSTYQLDDIYLPLSPTFLRDIPEKILGQIHCTATSQTGEQTCLSRQIEVLSYDQWSGICYSPELLTAFVLPNHPSVDALAKNTSDVLLRHTRDGSLSGYQSGSRERVLAITGAIFTALREHGIQYCNPPANFEASGQKVRLPDRVMEQRLATCLDITCLYAAVLEQAGLHPIILLTSDHAFAGVWLVDDVFAEAAGDDARRVAKRVELGEIFVFDPTMITIANADFAGSSNNAKRLLSEPENIQCVLDVVQCRKSGIVPIPIGASKMPADSIPSQPSEVVGEAGFILPVLPELAVSVESSSVTKTTSTSKSQVDGWKKHLLDLSNHNRLLSFRDTKKTAQLICHSLAELEDRLADGFAFELLPRADNDIATGRRKTASGQIAIQAQDAVLAMVKGDFQNKRLRLKVPQEECGKRLLGIFREARTALQDSGANLLFLALGFLHWKESGSSDTIRRAPLILLPLELIRKNGTETFSIRMADDEPRVNTTLLEMLWQEHGIAVKSLDPLPQDEHGVDIPAVFTAFRLAVKEKDGWHIEEDAAIGLFSFTKYLMWRDLDEHADMLEQHPLLSNLIDKTVVMESEGAFPEAASLDQTFEPRDTFCPLSADSSQLAAIYAAESGRNFIVNGPPGTGKSQTIANMIAHCLSFGKSVLFVAEKAAALNVVYDRLKKIGLGRFCLELHSKKAQKKEVIDQIRSAWNAARRDIPEAWTTKADNLAEIRRRLNQYCDSLHKRRILGKSLFWGISKSIGYKEEELPPQRLNLPWRASELTAMDERKYENLCHCVLDLEAAAKKVGNPARHPWRDVNMTDWKPILTDYELTELLDKATRVLPGYAEAKEKLLRLFPVALHGGVEELRPYLAQFAALLTNTPKIASGFIQSESWNELDEFINKLASCNEKKQRLKSRISEHYSPEFLEQDLSVFSHGIEALKEMGFIRRFFFKGKVTQVIMAFRLRKDSRASIEQLREDVDQGMKYHANEKWYDDNAAFLGRLFGRGHDIAALGRERLYEIKEWVFSFRKVLTDLSSFIAGGDKDAFLEYVCSLVEDRNRAEQEAAKIQGILRECEHSEIVWRDVKEEMRERLRLGDECHASLEKSPADLLLKQFDTWRIHMSDLEHWCLWLRECERSRSLGLGEIIERFEQGSVDAERMFKLFDASFCHAWMMGTIATDAALASYPASKLLGDLAHFKKLDDEYGELAKETVQARLSMKVQTSKMKGDPRRITLLRNQLGLKRNYLPIRKLLNETGEIIRGMMPCFLMSPISVAQYLDMRTEPFDVVIFDEASQIPTWDAIGAMNRGKQIIVAGDVKQLPPTNFFQRQANSDDDPEEVQYKDLESVLDDFIAANVKEVYLKWHYRSRNENLIAFSNHHYYDNRLLTFPSVDRSPGVSLRLVPGVYDKSKSRTNRIEAEAVVQEIMRRLADPVLKTLSIGVVTFNQAQQTLIEDLLDEARRGKRSLDEFFDTDNPNHVMVKNLENVQGDERDVMLMSICFGPDASGKVGVNFGPLNRDGGERRLNVAITRAKYEVVVFSSIQPEQIDITRTSATGPKHLRNYLEYAQRGPSALSAICDVQRQDQFDSPFEKQVAEALRKDGFDVVSQVGCSGYRIDLGVINPESPGHFILGVECDGANYHRAKTARDRDRLRELVLGDLGWKLHRIWSTEWFMHKNRELAKIKAAIESALDAWRANRKVQTPIDAEIKDDSCRVSVSAEEESAENIDDAVTESVPVPNIEDVVDEMKNNGAPADEVERLNVESRSVFSAANEYIPVMLSEAMRHSGPIFSQDARTTSQIRNALNRVVKAEAPILLERAMLRVVEYWGHERLTDALRQRLDTARRGMRLPQKTHVGKVFLWADARDMDTYRGFRKNGSNARAKRSPGEIAPEEYANAINSFLEHSSPVSIEKIREGVCQALALTTPDSMGDKLIDMACYLLVAQNRIIEQDGMYSVDFPSA